MNFILKMLSAAMFCLVFEGAANAYWDFGGLANSFSCNRDLAKEGGKEAIKCASKHAAENPNFTRVFIDTWCVKKVKGKVQKDDSGKIIYEPKKGYEKACKAALPHINKSKNSYSSFGDAYYNTKNTVKSSVVGVAGSAKREIKKTKKDMEDINEGDSGDEDTDESDEDGESETSDEDEEQNSDEDQDQSSEEQSESYE